MDQLKSIDASQGDAFAQKVLFRMNELGFKPNVDARQPTVLLMEPYGNKPEDFNHACANALIVNLDDALMPKAVEDKLSELNAAGSHAVTLDAGAAGGYYRLDGGMGPADRTTVSQQILAKAIQAQANLAAKNSGPVARP